MSFTDARIYQICFLSVFLLAGVGTRDWTLRPGMMVVAIATCLLTQWLFTLWTTWPRETAETENAPPDRPTQAVRGAILQSSGVFLNSLPSALITALGLTLLFRADHYSTMMLAGCLAIASKFLLRVQGKHLFNPTNFGILAALMLTPDGWVSPGQWGEEAWCALLFLSTGGLVLQRVGRWDTTVAFLGSYAALEALRNVWLGWTWDVWAHRLMNGSLLVFALFMITDPRTIPNARVGRIVWAIAIAALTFILRNDFFVSTAVLWALFALAPLTLLLDRLFPASRFEWSQSVPASRQSIEVQF